MVEITQGDGGSGGGGYISGVEDLSSQIATGNVTFVATHTPKYIISDGGTYFNNNGYTLLGLIITFTSVPIGYVMSFY